MQAALYTRRMSKEARLKEEIGWLKIVFAVAAALDASLVAWLAQAYNDANRFVLLAGLIARAGARRRCGSGKLSSVPPHRATGESVMEWVPIVALAALVVAMCLVVREAYKDDRK